MADQNMTENCFWDDYKCSDKGLLLPIVNEKSWPVAGRAAVYFIGLIWCFLGVAIIADTFMCAIEKITSKTRTIKIASTQTESGIEEVHVKVWNNTVANLTLMALGSSAPEILLSCIEIIGNGFRAGALGPSTIVGSAAFNLLVITAVCILSIPSPDIRRIKAFTVFGITAFFCVFAYLWLLIILVAVSPDFIELWEAIITFLFFPVLVIVAYLADKNFFRKKKPKTQDIPIGFDLAEGQMTDEKMRAFIKHLSELHPMLTEEDIAALAAAKIAEECQHDHLWYRINATRHLGGNPKLTPSFSDRLHEVYESLKEGEDGDLKDEVRASAIDMSLGGKRSVIQFTAAQSAVLENEKRVRVTVKRTGKTDSRVLFRVETIDGTAEATKDYTPLKQTFVFEKEEDMKHFDIEIIDDNEWEPDEVFFVKLALDPSDVNTQIAILGKIAIQEITIINDDEPGTFEFSKPSLLFKESAGKALIPIERHSGGDGHVEVKYRTEDMSAISGKDFEGGNGVIMFEHGEMTKTLEINIYDDMEKEKDECFRVELLEVSPGAKIGRIKKSIITIVNDDDFNGMVSRLVDMTNMNIDTLRVDTVTWAEQFRNAMNVNGGNVECASNMDYIMHFLTFGWKVNSSFLCTISFD
ncbi:hypothetical protein LSH36_127g04060 [Paralvinella palmiformis]|uniref:Calx-beta domain-containing protein n=1 Tax=Paralvinella palmiformis TaxID=53620 RepID=A0AAD9N870_9ANNE|nr:hypothetical protein LSH36_127g04060 [Paralvinella palmiformis]